MTKYLVIGANGMLGSAFVDKFTQMGLDFAGLTEKEIDITQPKSVANISSFLPEIIINCAAYTNVDKSEENKDIAMAVNAQGVANIAAYCKANGVFFVHFSTDYVFSGAKDTVYEEGDATGPNGVYGASKLEGERLLQEVLPETQCLILRTAWLYGENGKNFVQNMLNLAKIKPFLKVVNDQFGCPTYTKDLVEWTLALMKEAASGLYHTVNSGSCTWYELTKKAFELAGETIELLPITTEEYPTPAKRPKCSILSNKKLENKIKYAPRKWQEALSDYILSIKLLK